MKHDAICAWLGLKSEEWPPNHYALLGLEMGEANVARIEQRIHERMARLRCYQIANPEQATEGMNRLAQAFICLTDPRAKNTYDASLLPAKGAAPLAAIPASLQDTAVNAAPLTHVDWRNTLAPPPVRQAVEPNIAAENGKSQAKAKQSQSSPATSPTAAAEAQAPAEAAPVPLAAADKPLSASGPLARYKGFSPALLKLLTCRHGLGTRRSLYLRICKTRRVLHAWEQAGKYLRKVRRGLKNATEAKDLARALATIAEQLRGFPRFLGRPGQPGYRIVAQARLGRDGDWLNLVEVQERELLAQDWAAGQTLLSSHHKFLLNEVRTLRDLHGWKLVWRAIAYDFSLEVALLSVVVLMVLAAAVVALR